MRVATRPVLVRMMRIDQAVRTERFPNTVSLSREIEVSRRAIGRDIEYMRDQMDAPIKFSHRRNGYFYTEPTYKFPWPQLKQGELLAIFLAERVMRQLRGTPFESDIHNAIQKLGDILPDAVSVRLGAIADFLSVLPATEIEYDAENFNALTSAVVHRRQVEMEYWSASSNETTKRVVDPYALSLVDDGWYAIGFCHLRRDLRMFAVQRVQSVSETGQTFEQPPGFRTEDYLKGSFRAVRGDGDHHVVLRFKPELARRFAEKKYHRTQVLETEKDGSLIARMHLSSLHEIKRWVMWWGAECEVLEPPELRDLIARDPRNAKPKRRSADDQAAATAGQASAAIEPRAKAGPKMKQHEAAPRPAGLSADPHTNPKRQRGPHASQPDTTRDESLGSSPQRRGH